MKNIHVIALGSELLSGHVLESNSHWLSQQLQQRDAQVCEVSVLPDRLDRVVQCIREASQHSDIVVICGGLGPTDDDLTREALARCLNVELEFSEDAWLEIQQFFSQRQKIASPSNRRQAEVPVGMTFLSNSCGTAPGLYQKLNSGTEIYVFPGVPREFKAMCQDSLLARLPAQPMGPQYKLWGIGESNLVDLLQQHQVFPEGVEWGTIARTEGITVHFPHDFEEHPQAKTILENFEKVLAQNIYAKEDITPVQFLCKRLQRHKLRFATAESCTGGLLGSWITEISGSSEFFLGGVISYANSVKHGLLHVPEQTLENDGAVSEACARDMAQGAQQTLDADLAVSITGIAGPNGGTADKPVGTVHICASHRSGAQKHQLYNFSGHRQSIRERSAYAAALLSERLIQEVV